jgi:histidine triad (HIT) family protein
LIGRRVERTHRTRGTPTLALASRDIAERWGERAAWPQRQPPAHQNGHHASDKISSLATDSCFICDKHRQGQSAEGGIIFEDDLVYAGHVYRVDGRDAYLGYLMAEPKRHVVGLGALTAEEAGALGRLVNDLALALQESEGAEHVYSFVFGDGAVQHLHIHVVPRYPGTPSDFRGVRVTEWPEAPRGDLDQIIATCDRLRAALSSVSPSDA